MPFSIHPNRLTRARPGPLAVVVIISGLLLAGCGGSSSGPTVARISGASRSGAGSPDAGGAAGSGPADALTFAKCMRANGVPSFPDPAPNGGFVFRADPAILQSPALEAAQAKCRRLMPGGGPPGPGSTTHASAQVLSRMVKIAQCMRRSGVPDFPDPRSSVPSNPFGSGGGTGVISDIEGVIFVFPGTIDERSPVFAQAAAACGFPLHNH
jgi:hypothetical protein